MTWNASDACGNASSTSRTATWTTAGSGLPVITITGYNPNAGCNNNPSILPFGIASATDNCGGAITITSSTGSITSNGCTLSLTRTWFAVDGCGNSATTSRTVTWSAGNIVPLFTSTPASIDINCNDAIPVIVTPTASDACGTVTVTMTGSTDNTPNCTTGFRRILTRTFTATNACGNIATYTQTIRVRCCDVLTVCTLTQGAYGNPGGNICLPNGTTVNQTQIMIDALTNAPGNMKVFGRQDLNRYWVIRLSDVNQGNNSNIFKMLPGGGQSAVFGVDNVAGVPEFSNTASWPIVPLRNGLPEPGKIMNQLFSQTLTLYFNTTIAGNNLANVSLQGMAIIADRICGSSLPSGSGTPTQLVSPSIVSYLSSHGYPTTVAGLLQLANDALGGVNISPLTLSQIQEAVTSINETFDECKMVIGYTNPGNLITQNSNSGQRSLIVAAYPNPYEERFALRVNSPLTGQATVSFYTIDGIKIAEMKKDVIGNTDVIINYTVTAAYRTRIVYTVSIGGYNARGIVLSPN